ncbi:MAG: aminotransferase class I/II-fold pyridoxal phosphate-dependent enzyme [Methylobacter tundripaludum]|uniref:Glycine C-acetyltransferase n=1 Tax=Methylobacter tundripaludum TaxID=173365 RepID=A0A2S6HCU8_9GAMM|nr:aminotransferase class I/II-fold pyridoxal phosphate-dependent enzyme [Methylobacter tundripaludum]MDD4905199.1 aminotransferase class I/II-fold pyridoxal phosphate-dependent enzyme [Methylobacter tundripaludum]PPK75223.1 glycine C-acetyltransferase [Methylobacter tundripaludum]
MSLKKLEPLLTDKLAELQQQGLCKGNEKVITGMKAAADGFGPRYFLEGYGDRAFLRMNSNSYLGLAMHPLVIEAEAAAAEKFGTGPGAVRFISGTYRPHIELEQKLAEFHGRESAMLFSSAYTTMTGVLPQFISADTLVVSDALNHNCIINAIRLSHPASKEIYAHADIDALDKILDAYKGRVKRVCLVTDGIFSMRGDYAHLGKINACCKRHEDAYEQGIISIVDDSHGVGAFGQTGRGTEEYTQGKADILIATLGKAFGVNGGYVVSSSTVIAYLRETSPFYIYSNPITPAEAAAAGAALDVVSSNDGLRLLDKLRVFSLRLRSGLEDLGFETLPGEHPIVPILIRNTEKTTALVAHLLANNILVTGLNYPVVPQGEQEIRLQVSAEHTEKDLDCLLAKLADFRQ